MAFIIIFKNFSISTWIVCLGKVMQLLEKIWLCDIGGSRRLFSSWMHMHVSSLPFLFFVCLKSWVRFPSLVGEDYVKQLQRKFKFGLLLKQEKVYMSSLSMFLIRTMEKIMNVVELTVILIYRKIACNEERVKSVI